MSDPSGDGDAPADSVLSAADVDRLSPDGPDADPTDVDRPGEGPDRGDVGEEVVEKRRLYVETVFVVLAFVGMVGGALAAWRGVTPYATVGYAVAYVFGGWYGLKESVAALREPEVEIDLLMIVAALAALAIDAPLEGAILLFLFSLSNVLQHYAISRSRHAIESLMEMRPTEAQVLRDGEEETVPVDEVAVGDVVVVRPGDRIPLDGVVESGESEVDQSSLTGESVPVLKQPGDEVYGGTIVENGSLELRVTREAHESSIARVIHMVEEAQGEKSRTQRLIDRLEQPYVLGVFGLTIAAILVPLSLGAETGPTVYRAVTLMVAASPCAVIISTPAAVLSAITAGARSGVLFKGGEHVESAATVDVVALDKTGTLTVGDTALTEATAREDATLDGEPVDDDRLLALSAAVQQGSDHHLAEATVEAAADRDLDVPVAEGFAASVGKGVRATVDGWTVHIGNEGYFEERTADGTMAGLDAGVAAVRERQAEGKTSVLVAAESDDGGETTVLGWLAYTDAVRDDAADTVSELKALGVERVVMLTGDSERVAERVGEQVGVDDVYAGLAPEHKVDIVERLDDEHDGVAMVGDGVNDAPALAAATIGVSMGGAGSDVALETSDVVLMSDELAEIPYALRLSRITRRTLTTNLTIAFGAIVVMVVAILTVGLPIPLAVVGHEGSTVVVSLYGLRLLGYGD